MSHLPQGGQQYPPQQASASAAPTSVRPDMVHAFKNDPRYPSPRALRRTFAFIIDFVLHFGCAVGVFFWAQHVPNLAHLPTIWALVAWIVVSFVHRTIIQRMVQTTLGKAIFGLCLIRKTDGGRPRFGQLIKAWFAGLWAGIAIFGAVGGASSSGDGDIDEAFLPAVRFRDVRALRQA